MLFFLTGVDLEDYNGMAENSSTAFHQPRNHIPQHVLNNGQQDGGDGMASPGQRAAAAIAGAMSFVKRRTQKRRERRFDNMLGGST